MASSTDDVAVLRSSNWSGLIVAEDFTDQRVEHLEAMSERRITAAIQQMTSGGVDGVEPSWIDFLIRHMQVSAFVAEGTRRALAIAAAQCSDAAVGRCLTVQTMMYERQAQSVVLYAMDLARQLGDIPIAAARRSWEQDAVWQPAREYLARAAEQEDWTEIVVAINVCFEPVAGQLLRREFGSRAALAASDAITPVVSEAGQVEWSWVQEWTIAFLRHMLVDDEFGAANRGALQAWVADYGAEAAAAAEAMATLAAGHPWQDALEAGLESVLEDRQALLAGAGV